MRAMCFEVGEAHVLPGLAAVGRLVDAVAPRAALAVVVLAAADPDGVGVVRVDRDVADRHRVVEIVEQHFPGGAVVHRLPQAAGGGADVEHRGIGLEHREVVDAAAHRRGTDVAELQAGKRIRRCRWRGSRRSWPGLPSRSAVSHASARRLDRPMAVHRTRVYRRSVMQVPPRNKTAPDFSTDYGSRLVVATPDYFGDGARCEAGRFSRSDPSLLPSPR